MGGRSRMSISRPATKTDVWFEERYVNIDFRKIWQKFVAENRYFAHI